MKALDRTLNLSSVVAISMGAMLGGEIFVLPAVAAGMTGASLWLAYVLAAALVFPAAMTKAELATAIPSAGGSYLYVERAMGPMAGTIAGMGLWLSLLLKSAFALAVLASYLSLLVEVPASLVALVVLAAVTALNTVGVKKVGKVQTYIVAGCVVVLLGLVVAGGPRIDELRQRHGGPEPWLTDGVGGLLSAAALVFISYAGVTKIAAIAEEIRDEARNIPLGIIISLSAIATVYTAVSWVLAGIFPSSELQHDTTPIASLAGEVLGPVGVPLVVVTAIAALTSMANAGLLAASRFPLAMARDQLAPAFLRRIHPTMLTPVAAIALTSVAMATMVLTLDVLSIAKLASAFMIAAFVVVNVALILFRESKPQWYKPRFSAPLYPLLPLVGIATGVVLLFAMAGIAFVGLSVLSSVGVVLYFAYGRRRASRLGVLRQILRRNDLIATASRTGAYPAVGDRFTLVALFGGEPSAEALVQIGATLAHGSRIEVIYLREIPEQTDLAAMLEPDDRIASLERRVLAVAAERRIAAEFAVTVTRDVRKLIYEQANRPECDWVVMAWRDRTMRGILLRDPFRWLIGHLPCNLALFRDAGIRTYRHLMTVAEPGPHDALVASTADALAGLFRADITFVAHANAHGGDRAAAQAYIDELVSLGQSPASSEVVEGDDDVTAIVHASARFDMVILGAPPEQPVRAWLPHPREERITELAHCAVLRLKTPRAATHGVARPTPAPLAEPAPLTSALAAHLEPSAVRARLDVSRRDQLFAELAQTMSTVREGLDPEQLQRALIEREGMQSTAMGHGLAIPHATVAGLDTTILGAFTLARPAVWSRGVEEEVDVCFCVIGPPGDRATHLRLLADVARLVLESGLADRMRATTTDAELRAVVTDREPATPDEPDEPGEPAEPAKSAR